jgi:hypothetical protein
MSESLIGKFDPSALAELASLITLRLGNQSFRCAFESITLRGDSTLIRLKPHGDVSDSMSAKLVTSSLSSVSLSFEGKEFRIEKERIIKLKISPAAISLKFANS